MAVESKVRVTPRAERAVRIAARSAVFDNIGELADVALPVFLADQNEWVVPVLVRHGGAVVVGGEVVLNAAGEVLSVPSRADVAEYLRVHSSTSSAGKP